MDGSVDPNRRLAFYNTIVDTTYPVENPTKPALIPICFST